MPGTMSLPHRNWRSIAALLAPAVVKTAMFGLCALPGTAAISVQAQAIDRTGILGDIVSLACWIEDEKVIAVVNSSGRTLPAGTKLSVDAIRLPDGTHYRKNGKIGRTPPGTIIRMGAVQSSSCTAWARPPRPIFRSQ